VFTGLIREIGRIEQVSRRGGGAAVRISAPAMAGEVRPGDSVAVDGACLTAETVSPPSFVCFISGESLVKTTLESARTGDRVNLEPALRPGDRMGGHMVQGHVEGIGDVLSLKASGEWSVLTVRIPRSLLPYVVPKGSIALGGVSLTVAGLRDAEIDAAVIPATLEKTTIGGWSPGRSVNVESDIVGRYIVSYLNALRSRGAITLEDLERSGF